MRYLILLVLFLSSCTASQGPSQVQRGLASTVCDTEVCKTFQASFESLKKARSAYTPPVVPKVTPQSEWPKPTPESKAWSIQRAQTANMICAVNFDSLTPDEKKEFLKVSVGSYEIIDESLARTELAQCLLDIQTEHTTEFNKLAKELGFTLEVKPILKEGKPPGIDE